MFCRYEEQQRPIIGYQFIATNCLTLILRFSDRCLTLYFGCGIVLGQRAELYGRRCCCTAAFCSGQAMHAGVRVRRPRLVVAKPCTLGYVCADLGLKQSKPQGSRCEPQTHMNSAYRLRLIRRKLRVPEFPMQDVFFFSFVVANFWLNFVQLSCSNMINYNSNLLFHR